jgi:MFS family permease
MDQQSRQGERSMRKNLKIGIGEGVLATPWVYLSIPGGFIITALITQYYGLGPALFGLIISLPAWANALQILYLPVVTPFLKPRDMALGPAWLNLGLWIMLAAILPFLPRDDTAQLAFIFIVFFAMASLSASLIGIGWTGWVQTWVPSRIRGKYFGKRNLLIQSTTVAFLLLAMILLEVASDKVWPYQVLILLAASMRFFSILWQHLISAPEEAPPSVYRGGWIGKLKSAWGEKVYRRYVLMMVWVTFWMSSLGGFTILYGFEYLDISKSFVAAISILATLSGALMMPFWGSLLDRYGCVRVLVVSLLLWWSTGYAWIFLTPETAWVLYFTWFFGGAVSGGFLMGALNLLFKVLPPRNRTAGISLNLSLNSIAAAIAPVIVGFILGTVAHGSEGQQVYYKWLFFISTTMVMLTAVLALRIPEKTGSSEHLTVMGTMRAFRLTMTGAGMAAANNINLILHPSRKTKAKKKAIPPA